MNCLDEDQMQKVTDNVKARYRRKGLGTFSNTWPPFHAKSFTSLAIVHQKMTQLQAKEDTTKIARIRTTGDIHKISELTSSIKLDNIHQIFVPVISDNHTPMSILIEGHPGIGKTTLAKEMCLQWANNQLLTSDKLVLLLMLRDPIVQKITSIEQLVRYTQSTDQVQCVMSYLQNNNGLGVTLIIDGFDELSIELRQISFIRKVIEGDILHNIRVVVTSRPSASVCLHQCIQRRIEVLGFEKSSKEQYVNNALKDTPEHLHKLKVHFQEYPNIDALCYIPLHMAIMVYLCLLGSLPPTATKMYESFILHTVCRHLKRVRKIPDDSSATQIDNLPQPVCAALQQLQKVAFDGLEVDKIVFTVEELPLLCREDPICYGILQSTECYSAEKVGIPTQSFNFLHLGIQEYFAAKYVTTLPEDEVNTLLKMTFISTQSHIFTPNSKSIRLANMWILYCGITSGQCKTFRNFLTARSKRFISTDDDVHIDDNEDCSSDDGDTYSSHGHSIVTKYSTTSHSISKQVSSKPQVTSGKVIGPYASRQESTFDQSKSNTMTISHYVLKDTVMVLYLFQCFQEAQDSKLCKILAKSFDDGTIYISRHSLAAHQVVSLGFFLSRSHRKWKELTVSSCNLRDHGLGIIHQYLCGNKGYKQEVKEVDLVDNNLTEASSHLIADIINHLQPHTLSLSHNNITNVRDISTAAINTSTVKVLHMNYNGFSEQEAIAISNMVICLEELYINNNELGDHGAELLSNGIKITKTLRVLDIGHNNIGPSGTVAIVSALTNNTSLKNMLMDDNKIGQDGATAIAKAIPNNRTLKKLSLRDDTIDEKSAMIIIKSLHYNDTIIKLTLSLELCTIDGIKEEF